MAHNLKLNQKTGVHAFFSVKEKPWHSLGNLINDYVSSEEAIKLAGMDYEVKIVDNYFQDDFGNWIKTDSRSTFITEGGVAIPFTGKLGGQFEVIQNHEAFAFFDTIAKDNGVMYETAGCLGKGETIFITAKLPNSIKVREDIIDPYIVFTMSHNGRGSVQAFFTPIRVVCNNTLTAALGNHSNRISVKHTRNAKSKLVEAAKVWKMVETNMSEQKKFLEQLSRVRVQDAAARLILTKILPDKKIMGKTALQNIAKTRDEIFSYYKEHPTQKYIECENTAYGLYNGITGYFQNVKNYKNPDAKFKSILMDNGIDNDIIQNSFDLITQL